MKKVLATVATAIVVTGSVWFMQPVQPHHYELHRVTYGETLESIVRDANQGTDVNYDVRDAVATAVAESKKMEGGATSRSIKVGDKVAVPIYR